MDGNGSRPLQVGDTVNHNLVAMTTHPLLRRNAEMATLANVERVSHVTEEQRQEARAKHQRQIAEGYIDLGPVPNHSKPVDDIRDMRDPTHLFEQLSNMRDTRGDCQTLKDAVDVAAAIQMQTRPYTGEFIDHAALRREELEARAAAGDRFAVAELKGESLAEDPVD